MDKTLKKSIANSPTGKYIAEVLGSNPNPSSSVTISEFADDFEANVGERTIRGIDFTPRLNFRPRIITCLEYTGLGVGYIHDLVLRIELNPDEIHWDIIIADLEENINDVTINVL